MNLLENNEEIPSIRVTNQMLKKSYMSRWYFIPVSIPVFYFMYSLAGFIIGLLSTPIILLLLFSLVFSLRLAINTHFLYKCVLDGEEKVFDKQGKLHTMKDT